MLKSMKCALPVLINPHRMEQIAYALEDCLWSMENAWNAIRIAFITKKRRLVSANKGSMATTVNAQDAIKIVKPAMEELRTIA